MIRETRGLDLSGTRQGAGGIGGLLARTDHSTITPTHAFYHSDSLGNITALVNNRQLIVARYLYDPFGNTLSLSGTLADANVYRFSSQEFHANSGLKKVSVLSIDKFFGPRRTVLRAMAETEGQEQKMKVRVSNTKNRHLSAQLARVRLQPGEPAEERDQHVHQLCRLYVRPDWRVENSFRQGIGRCLPAQ